ncbi:5860_t:CDS:1, partial [Funneliformis mosseae]
DTALFILPNLKFLAARLTISKAPTWFLKLQSLLISSPNTRIIPSYYHHPHTNNIYSIPLTHIKSTIHFAVS